MKEDGRTQVLRHSPFPSLPYGTAKFVVSYDARCSDDDHDGDDVWPVGYTRTDEAVPLLDCASPVEVPALCTGLEVD